MYEHLFLSYTQWKAMKVFLTATAYYMDEPTVYSAFLVDTSRSIVWRTEVEKSVPTDATLTDFVTNIKPSAVVHASIADGIADQIIP